MTLKIEDLLAGIEGTTVEFKEIPNNKFYRTIAAFANTRGGTVLLGVSDAKVPVGFSCTDGAINKLSDTIVNKLQVHPTITPITINGREIVRIDVRTSRTPIAYEGRYPTRVGNTTRDMLAEDLRSFFLSSVEWDGLTNDISLSEIDEPTVRVFLAQARAKGRLDVVDPLEPVESVLRRLGLFRDGHLTNAAVLLFGKEPQQSFIGAVTRIGRFRKETIITGDRLIAGNLFNQLAKGEEAILEFINVQYDLSEEAMRESFVRKEIWDYPLPAIREALLNALVHRDYLHQNEQTTIKVYDDRIRFSNAGGLPWGVTVEELLAEPRSVPRNPLIAHVLYLAGLVERFGSGMERIVAVLQEAGLPAPEFKSSAAGFSLVMRKDPFSEKVLKKKGLSERQIMVILSIRETGQITTAEYRQLVGGTRKATNRDLRDLTAAGVLYQVGVHGKSIQYRLRNSGP
jgi:ATP-dependent DNA helicase RecG